MPEPNLLFCYGILKRGFEADLRHLSGKFRGEAYIEGGVLWRVGKNMVGLRLTTDPSKVAYGDLFEIPPTLWPYLDELEGNEVLYTRKVVPVRMVEADIDAPEVMAWVYEFTAGKEYLHHEIDGGVFEYDFN